MSRRHVVLRAGFLCLGAVASIAACADSIGNSEREHGPTTARPRLEAGTSISTQPTTDGGTGPNDATVTDANVTDGAASNVHDAGLDVGPLMSKPSDCFKAQAGALAQPDYDQFLPKMGHHCEGTEQQTITGVEKVVFFGDSITSGTPPTPASQYYRQLVVDGLKQRFGNIAVGDCSKWGAKNEDLLGDPDAGKLGQIQQCFPSGVETKRTLIVMTTGGNDIADWAKNQLSAAAAVAKVDEAADQLASALVWLKDSAHFPNGSWVIFSNVYEYTDTSGDLSSCPAAVLSGFQGNWAQGAQAVVKLQDLYMKHAVETGTDVMFLLEKFCGHGYRRDDPNLQCYRGPNADLWFDLTCYHPNPTGHQKIADSVLRIVDGP
jgi:lysophospholipase L1-like esterase